MNLSTGIPDQLGYLILHETGAIISSGGDLENDEKTAEIIYNLISLTENLDTKAFPEGGFNRISICFNNFCYVICMSNKKIHVIKRKLSFGSNQNSDANLIDLEAHGGDSTSA